LNEVLKLSAEARAALATKLIDSLDSELDEDVEARWSEELERRLAAIDAGACNDRPVVGGPRVDSPWLMSRRVEFHPAAREELEAAFHWYRARDPRIAEQFLLEVDRAIERISASPEGAPKYLHATRRLVCRRFPFVIVFRARNDEILVVAVAHGRRRPDYWRRR
jgi:putative addiction module component (TIGR02574 family)